MKCRGPAGRSARTVRTFTALTVKNPILMNSTNATKGIDSKPAKMSECACRAMQVPAGALSTPTAVSASVPNVTNGMSILMRKNGG